MNKCRTLVITLFALSSVVARDAAQAQGAEFPGLQKAMPAETFEQAGLNKLSSEEHARLDEFIRNYVATSNEKAANVAVDKAVKERGIVEPEVIQSNIVGLFSGYDGRSKFALANGQIWQQSQQVSRAYPRIDSPPVLITKGRWGWRMYIAGGGDLRVSKVK
jgi:hypothetical protein